MYIEDFLVGLVVFAVIGAILFAIFLPSSPKLVENPTSEQMVKYSIAKVLHDNKKSLSSGKKFYDKTVDDLMAKFAESEIEYFKLVKFLEKEFEVSLGEGVASRSDEEITQALCKFSESSGEEVAKADPPVAVEEKPKPRPSVRELATVKDESGKSEPKTTGSLNEALVKYAERDKRERKKMVEDFERRIRKAVEKAKASPGQKVFRGSGSGARDDVPRFGDDFADPDWGKGFSELHPATTSNMQD
jgi:hypothetical protein